MMPWHRSFHTKAIAGDRRYTYRPFQLLATVDQPMARASYPHKSVGAKYDFIDEHYLYPVMKNGRLALGQARRELAIPYEKVNDEAFMASLGYTINESWANKQKEMSTLEALKTAVKASQLENVVAIDVAQKKHLQCDMERDCKSSITHVDNKGYLYCTRHGERRKAGGTPCRVLRPAELKKLENGQSIRYR